MIYIPPNKIEIKSDNNVLQLVRIIKNKNKEDVYVYKFIKSEMKLNWEFEMSESFLKRQLTNYFKEIA